MTFKVLILCVVAIAFAEKYSDKYDNVNIQEIIENRRVLLSYANCLLDKGKCSPDGKTLKDNLKDAVETNCEKCTDAQKEGTSVMFRHLIEKEREIWNELTAKYDPTGQWRKTYEDEIRKSGIILP
ncbi:PREDICTED: ejaculatory bulb-specific protein 3-like [Papilio polytes]|uniref:ejaculatory bulb-specific protein 3-like n=1 Tax=Papilio polytes TaxID=76194 RepID=UPI0006760E82|nr:PREDICTED: ejaculatory bulb-specific protein 3-like [Papilio polytes]